MRSAEQQRLFEKFVEVLKKYKGKTVDTATLAEEVEKIYGSTPQKSAAGKLSDLRRENADVFKNIKISYTTRGQGDWNKAWKKDPKFRKFFKKKRPGVVWEDLTTAQRDIKSNTYNSYVYEKAKLKAKGKK